VLRGRAPGKVRRVNFPSSFPVKVNMELEDWVRGWNRSAITVVLILFAATALLAQENPQQLVQETIQNELRGSQHPNYWMYRDSDTVSGKTKVHRVVETPQCRFRWLLSINGQPPTAEQQQQQQAKIDRLVSDESARQKSRAAVEQDSHKAEDLMKMLPDAFLYTYDGEQGDEIRLKFRPNPQFSPPTNAAKVFHNMQGELLINKREKRLAGMDGTLTHNVDFGWGILGKLYKGGTFKVRQSEVGPQDWEMTMLDVHIHGRALFFHTISQDQTEHMTEFQSVPKNISLTQAASLAEHGNLNAAAKP